MTKTVEQMTHKFPHLTTNALRQEIDAVNGRVVQLQRGKAHISEAGKRKLSELQSTLHRMKMELKRREGDERRARHSITPSGA